VLTDYHVHLRPDDDGTPAAQYFTAGNAERYRAVAEERGISELGVAEHIHRFTQSLDVWQHPWWQKWARDDVDEYCAFVREDTDLRLGIEADFVAGREDRLANFLDAREWDYVVGSVHFIADEAVDMDEWSVWGRGESAEKVWRRYFETVGEAARTGMFDIMAHPDLVKVWGGDAPKPGGDLRRYACARHWLSCGHWCAAAGRGSRRSLHSWIDHLPGRIVKISRKRRGHEHC